MMKEGFKNIKMFSQLFAVFEGRVPPQGYIICLIFYKFWSHNICPKIAVLICFYFLYDALFITCEFVFLLHIHLNSITRLTLKSLNYA